MDTIFMYTDSSVVRNPPANEGDVDFGPRLVKSTGRVATHSVFLPGKS